MDSHRFRAGLLAGDLDGGTPLVVDVEEQDRVCTVGIAARQFETAAVYLDRLMLPRVSLTGAHVEHGARGGPGHRFAVRREHPSVDRDAEPELYLQALRF